MKQGRLWVCGGDFNMEPEELMASFDLQELGAMLVQPQEPTHEQGGKWRKHSHLLVHPGMASMVRSCEVDHSPLKGGHRAVVMELVGHTPRLMERVLRRREKLPMREPTGCRLPPPEWPEVPERFSSQEEAT